MSFLRRLLDAARSRRRRHVVFDYSYLPRELDWSRSPGVAALTRKALLAPGIVWGLHDIFFPHDYPEAWRDRFFNEQYLLMAYLMGGGGSDDILLPNGLVSISPMLMPSALAIFEGPRFDGIEKHGGCFWMRRGAKPRIA